MKKYLKSVLLFIVVLININWQTMDYKVLDWHSANKLKDQMNATFVAQPDFNFSKVYLLNDSSYLIMPLNPFGNSLLTDKKELLDKWISEQYFPVNDEVNKFYFENHDKIGNLIANKETLKQELYNYVFKGENKTFHEFSTDEIDNIYKLLQKKRKYQDFKLNFIVLVGDFILSQYKQENYRWGLLRSKQFLNPVMNLIIVTDEKEKRYYNLENKISGKFGYVGVQYYLKAISGNLTSRADEITEIAKVM